MPTIVDVAATEGDSDDAGGGDISEKSAETTENADMAETAVMADTTNDAEPEAAIAKEEAEIPETTRESNVTAFAKPGSAGADVW